MMRLCREEGIGVLTWSPLARGFLAGNRKRDERGVTTRDQSDQLTHDFYTTDTDFEIVDRVVELAQQNGIKRAQIPLAQPLHQPGITAPVIGASKMYQLEEAGEALEVGLSSEECAILEELYQPRPMLGYE